MAVDGGIGARLRAGREKLGLTVLQVAERIHTDPKIVDALEAEDYEALGAPVFARGHIRHYAELVGESATELNALYSNSGKVGQPDLTRIVKAPAAAQTNPLVAPALFVIAIFAVAGAVWWVSALSNKKPQLSETHFVDSADQASAKPAEPPAGPSPQPASTTPPSSTAGVASTTASPAVPAAAPSAVGAAVPSGSPAPASASVSAQPSTPPVEAHPKSGPPAPAPTVTRARGPEHPPAPQPKPQPKSAKVEPIPALPPPVRVADASGAIPASAVRAIPRPKNQAQMTLRYTSDSWTEVYDSTGARLFYDVGSANSVRTVVGTPPLRVVLGNAAGVAVEFNGRNAPIAKLSQPDGSAQFYINRAGRIARSKAGADGG
jgi:cytoskeleton protein RodZ